MNKIETLLRNRPIKKKIRVAFSCIIVIFSISILISVFRFIVDRDFLSALLVLLIAAIGVAATIVIGISLQNLIVEPVRELKDAAEKISKGDFDLGTSWESEDELGDLSRSFGRTASTL